MDRTGRILSKTDIRIPFDRPFVRSYVRLSVRLTCHPTARHGHRVLFEIALSRIMQYFSLYWASKGETRVSTENGPGKTLSRGPFAWPSSPFTLRPFAIDTVRREFQQFPSMVHQRLHTHTHTLTLTHIHIYTETQALAFWVANSPGDGEVWELRQRQEGC